MVRAVVLNIPFKGMRDYLQGPDIFTHVHDCLSEITAAPVTGFEIAFHHLAKRPLVLHVGDTAQTGDRAATGSYQGATGKVSFWLIETDGEISERVPYPEEDIIACTAFTEDSAAASLQEGMAFTDIEVWVAMIKEMHLRLFPDVTGKWLFARAKMSDYTPGQDVTTYGVTLASRFGHKLTRNEVSLDGRKVGDIFFALM